MRLVGLEKRLDCGKDQKSAANASAIGRCRHDIANRTLSCYIFSFIFKSEHNVKHT